VTETDRRFLARKGEETAEAFLRERGYRVLARNWRSPLGELDLIVEKEDTVVFVEVKTRSSRRFGDPEEAVTDRKKRKLFQVAQCYLNARGWPERDLRFDVLAILMTREGEVVDISHIAQAF
jgi:putative endonuclease